MSFKEVKTFEQASLQLVMVTKQQQKTFTFCIIELTRSAK